MPPVMIRKSFVAIVLTLSFLLAFDSTAMRHKPQYPQCEIAADFKAQGHCDSFGLWLDTQAKICVCLQPGESNCW